MIRSMTGYAEASVEDDAAAAQVVLRAYNGRHLDIRVIIDKTYGSLEERIKSLIADRVSRGRVEVRIEVSETARPKSLFTVDLQRAESFMEAVGVLEERFGRRMKRPVDRLSQLPDVIRPVEVEIDATMSWPAIAGCLEVALERLVHMRITEGAHLAEDLTRRLDGLADNLKRIAEIAEEIPQSVHRRLIQRIEALTAGAVELDPARISQEAAILAEKCDITEEIVRFQSHIEQFRAVLTADEPAGRKLTFLLQELTREINTLGVKAQETEIARIVVEMKSEVEKMKEQVLNLE